VRPFAFFPAVKLLCFQAFKLQRLFGMIRQESNVRFLEDVHLFVDRLGSDPELSPDVDCRKEMLTVFIYGLPLLGGLEEGGRIAPPLAASETSEQRDSLVRHWRNALPKEIVGSFCSFEKTQKSDLDQHFFKCHSCGLTDKTAVLCTFCVYVCHADHDVVYETRCKGYCDCYESTSGVPCQSKRKGVTRKRKATREKLQRSNEGERSKKANSMHMPEIFEILKSNQEDGGFIQFNFSPKDAGHWLKEDNENLDQPPSKEDNYFDYSSASEIELEQKSFAQ